jgi:hypothetical protein
MLLKINCSGANSNTEKLLRTFLDAERIWRNIGDDRVITVAGKTRKAIMGG